MPQTARPEKLATGRWRIRWFDHEGIRRSALFDMFADAERAQRERRTEADEIRRGLRRAAPCDRTFDELADYWLETRAEEKRSGADDASMLRKHLRPALGRLPLRAGARRVGRRAGPRRA